MNRGGRKVSKADLIELARALGDEEVDEAESMLCVFQRALDKARALSEPAKLFEGQPAHPKVREWCCKVMDYAAERRREMAEKEERDPDKWVWYAVYGIVRDSTGRDCFHRFSSDSLTCWKCGSHIDSVTVSDCSHKFVDSSECLHCGVGWSVLQAKSRRELEQIRAADTTPACEHAGELVIDRATGEESCGDCLPIDRRQNAEQWAERQGSRDRP